jgi:ribosome-associated protein YbcJ (S4-like RNA binding protein)
MASNLAGQWKVSFSVSSNDAPMNISNLEGEIHLWAQGRMVLMENSGTIVGARHTEDGKKIHVGTMIHFPKHFVKVIHCDFGPKDLAPDLEACDPTSSSSARNLLWKVTYSMTKDLDHGCFNTFNGTMHFWISEFWLILKNAKDAPIAVKLRSKNQSLMPGSKIHFFNYVVRVGVYLSGDPSTLTTANVPSPKSVIQSSMHKVLEDQRVLSIFRMIFCLLCFPLFRILMILCRQCTLCCLWGWILLLE